MRSGYAGAIIALSALSLLFALGVIIGEALDQWFAGGALVGALLLAYAAIVGLLRKMGIIGPRKAER